MAWYTAAVICAGAGAGAVGCCCCGWPGAGAGATCGCWGWAACRAAAACSCCSACVRYLTSTPCISRRYAPVSPCVWFNTAASACAAFCPSEVRIASLAATPLVATMIRCSSLYSCVMKFVRWLLSTMVVRNLEELRRAGGPRPGEGCPILGCCVAKKIEA